MSKKIPNAKLNLDELEKIIKEKISSKEKNSYTYSLFKEGIEKINRKLGEEALETLIGSFIYNQNPTKENRHEVVKEICDLFYHALVLMAAQGIEVEEIWKELGKRNKKNEQRNPK
jgi:phosphoribosyl-ATP pyrophosphohydrolase